MKISTSAKPLFTFLILALMGGWLTFGMASCSSQKKKAEAAAAAAKAQKISKAKTQLEALLANNDLSAEELEKALQRIISATPNDPSLTALIGQVKTKIETKKKEEIAKKAAEEAKRLADEEARLDSLKRAESMNTVEYKMENLLTEIATANGNTAYDKIDEALELFESERSTVLVIIYKSPEGKKDYDKPKIAVTFLEYVKDTKKAKYVVESYKKNADGKITVLELLQK